MTSFPVMDTVGMAMEDVVECRDTRSRGLLNGVSTTGESGEISGDEVDVDSSSAEITS